MNNMYGGTGSINLREYFKRAVFEFDRKFINDVFVCRSICFIFLNLTKPADIHGSLSCTCDKVWVSTPHWKLIASHVAVETPTIKPALSSKYMVGKVALYFQNHFKNWSKFIRVFSFKSTSGSIDKTMLLTVVVSASRRSSLILSVVID